MAQVALAWVLSKPVVSCPIVGATKPHHLQTPLPPSTSTSPTTRSPQLEEPYTPQDNYWW